jgi:hypothetical protein
MREAFLLSRTGAILRCAAIMVESNRKDLARQILKTTNIDKKKLGLLKTNLGT